MKKEEIKQEKSSDQQNFFEIECKINKWGDIHFKKAMLEELAKISQIAKEDPLIMSFKRDCIEIRKKQG